MVNISYNGFDNKVIAMESSSNIANGALVTIASTGKCTQCTANQEFIGVAVCKRDSVVSVQVGGYVECKYTGTAPSKGYTRLKASAATTVVAASNDDYGINKYKVLKVDETNKIVGFIL